MADALVEDDLEGMQKALEHLDRLLEREEVARALAEQDDETGKGAASAREQAEEEGEAGARPDEEGDRPGAAGDEDSEERRRDMAGGEEGEERRRIARADEEDQQGQGRSPEAEPRTGEPSENTEDQPGRQARAGEQQDRPGDMRSQPRDQAGRSSTLGGRFDPDRAMRDFAERGYQDWLEELRDAEALLPEGTPLRTEVTRLRERVEMIRREWRARALAPQFDLFLEFTARPLAETAEELQREIEERLSEDEFRLVDEGDIPERYREQVAEYFKRLADAEAAP